MSLVMREAAFEDLRTVLSLYRQAGLDVDNQIDHDAASEIWRKIATYPFYKIYLAEMDSTAVGTFALLVMDNLAHRGARSGIVEAVAVHPSRQGQGIGKEMMRFALSVCRAANCYKMALSSNANRTNAHAFYEKLGFRRHGYSFLTEL